MHTAAQKLSCLNKNIHNNQNTITQVFNHKYINTYARKSMRKPNLSVLYLLYSSPVCKPHTHTHTHIYIYIYIYILHFTSTFLPATLPNCVWEKCLTSVTINRSNIKQFAQTSIGPTSTQLEWGSG